ncbi:MAG TPA: GMC family oxidoreductase [Steroidobacteraceae bacterium]|nr:GMC family oxidoreductase [Steroidobacteraceae bacterium]
MKQFAPNTEVDFVVIGSGAAGAVMAKELAVAGFSVVVLEQGGWGAYGHEQDYIKDELLHLYSQDPVNRLMSDPNRQRNTFRRSDKEKALPGTHSYGCVVGGGTVTYGASSWRHLPYEFAEATHEGTIAGSGLSDWPISYDELEPYYTKAEWQIGISGQRLDSPLFSPMSKDYPVPPLPQKSSGALFRIAAAKLNLTVVPNVAAIITRPYQGRPACINCGMCGGYGCQVKAKSSSAVTLLPAAVATGRCEIRVLSYVREISLARDGKVKGAIYFDAQNREIFQKAKAVVLCANGTETPRLLLLSTSNLFPEGLANSSGLVGKYLMSGNASTASGLFDRPLDEYKGAVTGAAILDFVPSDPKRGFYGGGRMTARGQESPIQFALSGTHGAPSWGAGYKSALKDQANRKLTVTSFITQLPLETNRVDLDPEVKDAWGLPAMRITTTSHPNDFKSMEFFRQKSIEILTAAGANTVWADPVTDSSGGAHSRGTCRMGNDPKASVVNKFHRAHDVPNLYIVDGSSFVTGGRNHPTMTISALAFRAADHLVRAARNGGVV